MKVDDVLEDFLPITKEFPCAVDDVIEGNDVMDFEFVGAVTEKTGGCPVPDYPVGVNLGFADALFDCFAF